MNGFAAAVGLLTRLPAPRRAWRPAEAARWLPVVAVLLAALAGGAAWVAGWALPAPAAAGVALAVWVALSGALHLDGLADAADAALAAADRPRRLEILRDVHHGTFGVSALVLVLLLKFGALASLTPSEAAAAIFGATMVGRCWLPLVARLGPSLRAEGLGAGFRAGCTPLVAGAGVVAAFGGSWLALGAWGLATAGAGGGVAAMTAVWLRRAFGGLNGDAYGACIELAECAVVVMAAGLGGRLAPWGVLG